MCEDEKDPAHKDTSDSSLSYLYTLSTFKYTHSWLNPTAVGRGIHQAVWCWLRICWGRRYHEQKSLQRTLPLYVCTYTAHTTWHYTPNPTQTQTTYMSNTIHAHYITWNYFFPSHSINTQHKVRKSPSLPSLFCMLYLSSLWQAPYQGGWQLHQCIRSISKQHVQPLYCTEKSNWGLLVNSFTHLCYLYTYVHTYRDTVDRETS